MEILFSKFFCWFECVFDEVIVIILLFEVFILWKIVLLDLLLIERKLSFLNLGIDKKDLFIEMIEMNLLVFWMILFIGLFVLIFLFFKDILFFRYNGLDFFEMFIFKIFLFFIVFFFRIFLNLGSFLNCLDFDFILCRRNFMDFSSSIRKYVVILDWKMAYGSWLLFWWGDI